jgi:TolB-like protein/cytochrome c-type biogenesis protein CcmH/NrfG
MPDSTTAARAVFLSYAHEDAEPVRRIADALRAFGVEVWFDQNELRGGDAWDAKIRTQIRSCALCVPVISATTQARGEGYFRREWKIAVERTHDMAAGVPFLLPVVIDDTPESEALVPEEFMRVQWTRLPRGVPTPQFVEQVKKLLSREQGAGGREQGMRRPRPAEPTEVSSSKKSGPPLALWFSLAAVFVSVGVVFFVTSRKAATPPAATPEPKSQTQNPAPAKPERVADKSIAVLPFTNMSEEKDSLFFTDGIHEDILTNLALVRELRVVSRTSVMPYRKTDKPMKQIAQELGVTYILEGSVRRSGNKVRVTGQLIHAASDEHVWAASYDRDLTDIFTIQAELSQQIAAQLKAALSPEEKVLIARKPTENPAAYDFFLRARDILNREGNTYASRQQQIDLLEKAVALDPSFAQAWGELAGACAYWYFSSFDGMDEQLARAKGAMDRAMQLAPDDPEIYGSLGTYYYYGFRDYARATEQYERLARLQPNSPVVFNSLGLIQRRQGRWAQSLANSRRASELDPANIRYLRNLLGTLEAARRWDECIVAQSRIVALLPGNLNDRYQLAYYHFLATGSFAEVDAVFKALSPTERDSELGLNLRKTWAIAKGDFAEAVRLDRIQPYSDADGLPRWQQALFCSIPYLALGDRAGAIARLGEFPAQARALVEKEPNNVRAWAFLGGIEAVLGRKDEALRCMARTAELLPESRDALDGVQMAWNRALTYDLLGEKEKTLAEYTRLIRLPCSTANVAAYELKYGFSTLHGDPRFEALLSDPKNHAPLF